MAGSKNTALSDNDKLHEARQKDYESNLKSTKDDDQPTAAHLAAGGLLPSDIESFTLRGAGGESYGDSGPLSTAEAGEYARRVVQGGEKHDAVVAELVAGRTVIRQVLIEQPAGVSHPGAGPGAIAAAPAPPAPELLDPTQPRRDDPTQHVVRLGDDNTHEDAAREEAAAFVEAADKVTAKVDELGGNVEDGGTQEVVTE